MDERFQFRFFFGADGDGVCGHGIVVISLPTETELRAFHICDFLTRLLVLALLLSLLQIPIEALPAICAAAAADIKRPLSVVARYSFYWGTAASLDMAPLPAAIYNQWLTIWAAARPW